MVEKRDRVNFELSSEIRNLIDELFSSGEYVTESELMRGALLVGLKKIKKARGEN